MTTTVDYQPSATQLTIDKILYKIDWNGEMSVQQKGIYEPYFEVSFEGKRQLFEVKDLKIIDELKGKTKIYLWSGCEFTILNTSIYGDPFCEDKFEYVVKKRGDFSGIEKDKIYTRVEIIEFIKKL